MAKHRVARVEEIPPGSSKIVNIEGRSIGVFNVGGDYFALRNRCPHQGGPLCLGPVSGLVLSAAPGDYNLSRRGEIVRCPWHGWEFDIRTGQSYVDPFRVRVRRYEVTLDIETDGEASGVSPEAPAVKTFPVTIEQQSVFVEVNE